MIAAGCSRFSPEFHQTAGHPHILGSIKQVPPGMGVKSPCCLVGMLTIGYQLVSKGLVLGQQFATGGMLADQRLCCA